MARYTLVKCLELAFFWRAHLKACRDSDLNQREYCERHGLALKRFGNWRAKFKDDERVVPQNLLWRRGGGLRPRSRTSGAATWMPVKTLQRSQFGRLSERLDQDQLHLGLEDLDAEVARAEAALPEMPGSKTGFAPSVEGRLRLPDHLDREDVTLDVAAATCPCCGGEIHKIGETISEMLDYIPALTPASLRRRSCGGTAKEARDPAVPRRAQYLAVRNRRFSR